MKQRRRPESATRPAPGQAPDQSVDSQLGNAAMLEQIAFPHASAIESAFGMSIPGEALLDPDGCADRGVRAFTKGDRAHFAEGDPTLPVAAHEAVHVLQHAGRASDQGLGQEAHAETVADAVARGEDASGLLQPGPKVSGDEHPYTDLPVADQGPGSALEWQNPEGRALMVSDDGRLAVDNAGFGNSQAAWAPAGDIASANTILEGQGSKVRLEAGSADLSGRAPDGSGGPSTLSRVVVTMADGSAATELTDDCGTASHEVMGAHDDLVASARIGDGAGGTTHTDPHRYVGGGGAPEQTAAETYFEEVMAREWPALTRDERYARWGGLSDPDRDAFERKYQIGRYAVPGVGEGITVASLYDTPGWTTQPGAGMTWNFHYATSILVSGHDYVTLENYADHGPGNWYFWMSGPASKGQSFWDQHEQQQGTSSTAFVVNPAHRMLVDVTNVAETDWWGDADFQVRASTATGGSGQSEEQSIPVGGSSTFGIRLADILPQRASEPITVEVVENDLWSTSLLSYTWSPPFDTPASGGTSVVSATARMET